MSYNIIDKVNSNILSINPYLPGKPIDQLAREMGIDNQQIIKLASNENPLGVSSLVLESVNSALSHASRYPDGDLFVLRDLLAQRLNVDTNQIIFGNGSSDLFVLLASAWLNSGCSAVMSQYAFVVYSLVTQAAGAELIIVPANNWCHDLPAMLDAIRSDTQIVFLANPNNPTGSAFTQPELIVFLDSVPSDVLVVLDEAYIEYFDDENSTNNLDLLLSYPNLLITRTFSKIYGLAGLRIGYAVASKEICQVLNKIRQPFNVNYLAEVAAISALKDGHYLTQSRLMNRQGMIFLQKALSDLQFSFIPSKGNFITFDTNGNALLYYEELLKQGVIVRPLIGYGMLKHLRVTIGTLEENQRFIQALTKVKKNMEPK